MVVSDDEFNRFVMNKVIDLWFSNDENDLCLDVMHMIIDDLLNYPGRINSVEGHEVVHPERLAHHSFFTKTIS